MKYRNLHELLQNSQSSRTFFLSLPVEMQYRLHEHNAYVHSAAELRTQADAIRSCDHLARLGGWKKT